MNRSTRKTDRDELRPEYDFSKAVRGKHFRAYQAGSNVVLLEPDLVEAFPDSASVNQALRMLVRLSRSKALSDRRPTKASQATSRGKGAAKSTSRARATRG
jgi:hypothetical protein